VSSRPGRGSCPRAHGVEVVPERPRACSQPSGSTAAAHPRRRGIEDREKWAYGGKLLSDTARNSRWTTSNASLSEAVNSSETTEISRRARLARQKCSCPDRSRCPSLTRAGNSTTDLQVRRAPTIPGAARAYQETLGGDIRFGNECPSHPSAIRDQALLRRSRLSRVDSRTHSGR